MWNHHLVNDPPKAHSTEALQLDVGQVLLEIQGLQVAMNSGGEKLTKPFENICGF